jgi:hypothetical protein
LSLSLTNPGHWRAKIAGFVNPSRAMNVQHLIDHYTYCDIRHTIVGLLTNLVGTVKITSAQPIEADLVVLTTLLIDAKFTNLLR